MNIEKETKSQLSTAESKQNKTTTKQTNMQNRNRIIGMGKGEDGEKVQGLRSTNWQVQNRQGDVKNTVRN